MQMIALYLIPSEHLNQEWWEGLFNDVCVCDFSNSKEL